MDKKPAGWADALAAIVTAWMLMPADQRRRVVAATLRTTGSLARAVAEHAGRAALACERAYHEVLTP